MFTIETVTGAVYGDSHDNIGDAIRQAEAIAVELDIDLDIVDGVDDTVAARVYADGTATRGEECDGMTEGERRYWQRVDDDERTGDARNGR